MSSYVALLRGVNLLGVSTLKMTDLKSIAEELGLDSVRTYIASGNLLFQSLGSEEELRLMLQERLLRHMGRDVRVMLRTAEELETLVRSNPFPELQGNLVQAFFLNEPPPADLLASVRNRANDERIAFGPREVFVAYGEQGIGKSRLRIPVAEAGTARNMNTVVKLAELAREMS
ncbi:MAG: DUF1697 domain-containing protein [Sphingomonas sp.]|jgi:uncharacterized protein (DUF1697 family)